MANSGAAEPQSAITMHWAYPKTRSELTKRRDTGDERVVADGEEGDVVVARDEEGEEAGVGAR